MPGLGQQSDTASQHLKSGQGMSTSTKFNTGLDGYQPSPQVREVIAKHFIE